MARILCLLLCLLAAPASAEGFRGAMVHKLEAPQTVAGNYYESPWTKVEFPAIAYDTDGLWDGRNHQFVIPEGVRFVRLTGQIVWSHNTVGSRQVLITKNGKLFDGYAAQNSNATLGTTPDLNVSTAVLKVNPGDTFQLQAWQMQTEKNETTEIYGNGGTWFSIEVVE